MRTLMIGVLSALLAACQTPENRSTPTAGPPLSPASVPTAVRAYRPALDTRAWRADVAAPPTQMAVLGSAHLAQIDGFDAARLDLLLDQLAAFNPAIITQEGVSGEQCQTLVNNPAIYKETGLEYCSGLAEAKAATGLDFPAARAEAERLLAHWPAAPTPARRRRLATLFLASGDRPSAHVQWLQLAPTERRTGDGVTPELLTILTRKDDLPNERMEIGAALAARLGLQRIHAVDDQTAITIWERAGPGMDAAIEAHWQASRAEPSPVIEAYQRAQTTLNTSEAVLEFFRFLNSPAVQMEFVESDFRDALKLPGPDHFGQQYYAYNDVRNWRMVANILDVTGNAPGARVLNIVGASHKAYYEAYLDRVPYVELVDMETIFGVGTITVTDPPSTRIVY